MSASGVFGPAPAGIDLSETQNGSIKAAVISLMVIGSVFVFLRLIARTMQKGITLAADDYCIALALLFSHGTAICSLVSLPYGGGKHLWVLEADQFTTIWQILFAYVMIYAFAVTFTKLSIVLFYRRLFGMTWGLWACVFLVLSYWATVVITINVSCQPVSYFWTQYVTKGATGHCINVPLFFFANGIWAMLVDVCILIVPIPIVYGLQMPHSQKMAVYAILLLGSFVCIASVVRITTIHTVISSTDLTWAMGKLFIWSCCEPFIGIVCACLPTLAPFFRRWWQALQTRKTDSGSSSMPMPGQSAPIYSGGFGSKRGNKSIDDTLVSSSGDFRMGKSKREWSRIQSERDLKLRSDDEVELRTDITGPASMRTKTSDEETGSRYLSGDIRVKKDVSWSSAHLDDHAS